MEPSHGNYGLASWGQRAAAILLDGLIISLTTGVLAAIILHIDERGQTITGGTTNPHPPIGGVIAFYYILVAPALVYYSVFDGSGQTIGKLALGIAVRDVRSGRPIGVLRAFVRRFVNCTLFLLLVVPGILNVLSPLWDAQNPYGMPRIGHGTTRWCAPKLSG
jgi:uncharacterized RDD family membrane protein YckC